MAPDGGFRETTSRLVLVLRKHTLWAGFIAVAAPLLVLLGMQFVWLSRLERATAMAHRATLTNYLEAVATETEYFYRSTAERALNVPAALFTGGRLAEAAARWKAKPVEGVKRLFLVDFTRTEFGSYRFFNTETGLLESPPASDESLAVIVACNPFQMISSRARLARSIGLSVDERNPEFRIILNPITDESEALVGIAGMIVDEGYFRTALLPRTVRKAVPWAPEPAGGGELRLAVRDVAGEVIFGDREEATQEGAVLARFPFMFADYTMALRSARTTPETWARASFLLNAGLAALLAVVLLGGVVLALRAADRAMRLSQMKSDFVSTVSHELRTPLSSVRVFAELLRLGRVTSAEKVKEYGEYIEAESRRLSRLIDNILDFSRIESGRKTYQFVPTDLREVVAATLRTFQVHLRDRGFRIAFEAPEDPLPSIPADPDAIGQALHNLLDNAVKYSGESRDITVRLARDGDALVLSVTDHGIGIPRHEQRKIFERFHRVSTGLVHEAQGSGLGLSIVDHIARVHRGTVTVESEPGRGSTFSLRLPAGPAGAPPAGITAADPRV